MLLNAAFAHKSSLRAASKFSEVMIPGGLPGSSRGDACRYTVQLQKVVVPEGSSGRRCGSKNSCARTLYGALMAATSDNSDDRGLRRTTSVPLPLTDSTGQLHPVHDAQSHPPPLLANLAHCRAHKVSTMSPSTATWRPGYRKQMPQCGPYSTATDPAFMCLEGVLTSIIQPGPCRCPCSPSTLWDIFAQPDRCQQLTGLCTLGRA